MLLTEELLVFGFWFSMKFFYVQISIRIKIILINFDATALNQFWYFQVGSLWFLWTFLYATTLTWRLWYRYIFLQMDTCKFATFNLQLVEMLLLLLLLLLLLKLLLTGEPFLLMIVFDSMKIYNSFIFTWQKNHLLYLQNIVKLTTKRLSMSISVIV